MSYRKIFQYKEVGDHDYKTVPINNCLRMTVCVNLMGFHLRLHLSHQENLMVLQPITFLTAHQCHAKCNS